jgi:hypothetical protein
VIDFTASQAQSSAEQACPLRQTILVDAHQRGRIVRHDGHPRLHDGTTMAFVREAPGSTTQQAGNDAFDERSAVSRGVGELHLAWSLGTRQARLAQDSKDVPRSRRWREGIDRVRDPHGENPLLVQRLTQGGVIKSQIAGQGTDSGCWIRRDPRNRLLHLIDQGLHIAGITRIPHGQMQAKDEACRGLRNNARFTAKLRGAVAFALTNGRNGGVVGVDDFAVGQCLALREPSRLLFDPLLSLECCCELIVQALSLGLRQLWSTAHIGVGGLRQGPDLIALCQQLPLRLPDQPHKHFPHAPALSAKATHDLLEVVLKLLRFHLQRGARGSALYGYGRDELEDFF